MFIKNNITYPSVTGAVHLSGYVVLIMLNVVDFARGYKFVEGRVRSGVQIPTQEGWIVVTRRFPYKNATLNL